MLLWLILAAMTGAAALVVLWPLTRRTERRPSRAAADAAVYRDQLAEIERDRRRGLIGEAEAEAARVEIARRLIRADEALKHDEAPRSAPRAIRAVSAAIVILVPVLAIALYLPLGHPELPDAPRAARIEADPDRQEIEALVARVEDHLARSPEDGRGWAVLAPVYLRMGRADDAARAFANASRLLGPTAEREAGLGEALVMQQQGIVTAEARSHFQNALKLDPGQVKARFFLALALSQDGRREEAIAAWQALVQDAPADAPWVQVARAELARLNAMPTDETAPGAAPGGPTQEDAARAGAMAPQQRRAMIAGMVSGLAERLKSEPEDIEGWLRLVRSYSVLGQSEAAAAAARKAQAVFRDRPDQAARIEALAGRLGIVIDEGMPHEGRTSPAEAAPRGSEK